MNPWLLLLLNVLIHVTILLTILTVFFDLVISKTVEKAFAGEINKAINSNLPKALDSANVASGGQLCETIQLADPQIEVMKTYHNSPAPVVATNNKFIKQRGAQLAILFALLFIISYTLLRVSCGYCGSFTQLLVENLIIFVFIGAIEYTFFEKVAMNYVPVPPSLLTESFIRNLKESS